MITIKKTVIIILSLSIILVGCDEYSAMQETINGNFTTEYDVDITPEEVVVDPYYEFHQGDIFDVGRFRPIFYTLPAPFADLVGRYVHLDWALSRSDEERDNENVAVSFIRYFNISREDFTKANEQLRLMWESIGASAQYSSAFELYPVDLIFTFDNELINEHFLWRNSIVEEERGMGRE